MVPPESSASSESETEHPEKTEAARATHAEKDLLLRSRTRIGQHFRKMLADKKARESISQLVARQPNKREIRNPTPMGHPALC